MLIVIAIGVIVAFVFIKGIYRFFFDKNSSAGCGTCSDCEFNPLNSNPSLPKRNNKDDL